MQFSFGPKGGLYINKNGKLSRLSKIFRFFDDEFSVELVTNVKTPASCMKNLNVKYLTSGSEGLILSSSIDRYVLKIWYSSNKDYNATINISITMSKLNAAPKVYGFWFCPVKILSGKTSERGFLGLKPGVYEAAFMVLEMYDENLREWIVRNRKSWLMHRSFILKKISVLLKIMHSNGISHNDLHPDNILLRVKDKTITDMVLNDFGRATFSNTSNDSKTLAASMNDIFAYHDIPDRLSYKDFD